MNRKTLAAGLHPNPQGELELSPHPGSGREGGREGGRWENIFKISLPDRPTSFVRSKWTEKGLVVGRRSDPLDELNRSPDPGREREGAGREEMENIFKTSLPADLIFQVKMDRKTFGGQALPGPAGGV